MLCLKITKNNITVSSPSFDISLLVLQEHFAHD